MGHAQFGPRVVALHVEADLAARSKCYMVLFPFSNFMINAIWVSYTKSNRYVQENPP